MPICDGSARHLRSIGPSRGATLNPLPIPASPMDLSALLPDVSLPAYATMSAALAVAYVIFGIAGFGTALVAAPVLAYVMPVAQIVPLLALMDCSAALLNLARDGRAADRTELRRLVPCLLIGSLIGAALLLRIRADLLPAVLGVFVTTYAIWSLLGKRPATRLSSSAAVPFGLVGGICSAMFGSGGFLYAIYLSSRLDKDAMRVTQSTLIGLSTLTRLVLFLLAGVYARAELLKLAVALAPAMIAGLWAGRQMTLRMSREQFLRVVNVIVLLSGSALVIRAWLA
ncbi:MULTISPECIES: sulfite exporter TauE/SafE family protein [Cupriavidus]|uniref:sulfite exporter TauE/SafE family protein n=1 Tax=Cupriavidus TaxID=106589 RepID=UPI000ABEE7F2|nr:sulfite exporter TauE/SafE family protein [Cupriavidus metallidurans]MDE4918209.1 sulfite exporter TauE/SafE family protein [Cupriavidus metallidurans]